MRYPLTYQPFGESALLVEWPHEINASILDDITQFTSLLSQNQPDSICEIIQSVHAITIVYDTQSTSYTKLKPWLQQLYNKKENLPYSKSRIIRWKIPVCYSDTFGLDLQEVSEKVNLPVAKVIALHSQSTYKIYSIGFLPGFLYLGGLDQRLHIARKHQPRLKILRGAVGIGGRQTGIYPVSSPGGWQIIGNTPVSLFDVSQEVPCFAKPGDEVQFHPISLSDHQAITARIATGNYTLEKETLHD